MATTSATNPQRMSKNERAMREALEKRGITVDIPSTTSVATGHVVEVQRQITPVEHDLEQCAARVIAYITELDPTWGDRDKACEEEQHLSDLQRLCKYTATILDRQEHLTTIQHPFFEMDQRHLRLKDGKLACAQCGNEYEPRFPGQATCSNECGDLYFAPKSVTA